jgi:hypothetical protein
MAAEDVGRAARPERRFSRDTQAMITDVSLVLATLTATAVLMTTALIVAQRRRRSLEADEGMGWDDAEPGLRAVGFERVDATTYVKGGALFVRNLHEHRRVEASLEAISPGGEIERFVGQTVRLSPGQSAAGGLARWTVGQVAEQFAVFPSWADLMVTGPAAPGSPWRVTVLTPFRDASTPTDAARIVEMLAEAARRGA